MPWFWKKSDAKTKNFGSSKTKAKIFIRNTSFGRSAASCNFLLSFKETKAGR